jgi:hypothetical protein
MRWWWLIALCACVQPEVEARTQVVVALYADPELASALSRVYVEVRDESGAELVSEHEFALDEPKFPRSFGVYRTGENWFLLIVRGMADGPVPLVEYKVLAQFVEHTTGLLEVVLSARCANVLCDPRAIQSCYAETGSCEPVTRVMPEAPATSTRPVPPTTHGASTLGGRRTDGMMTLSADGFERAERRCTSDGRYCVTGSLMP